MMTVLVIILVIALLGGIPDYGSGRWYGGGNYVGSGLGLVVLVLVILLVLGRI